MRFRQRLVREAWRPSGRGQLMEGGERQGVGAGVHSSQRDRPNLKLPCPPRQARAPSHKSSHRASKGSRGVVELHDFLGAPARAQQPQNEQPPLAPQSPQQSAPL